MAIALETLQEEIVFCTRGRKFGADEVRFTSEKLAAKHAREIIKNGRMSIAPNLSLPQSGKNKNWESSFRNSGRIYPNICLK